MNVTSWFWGLENFTRRFLLWMLNKLWFFINYFLLIFLFNDKMIFKLIWVNSLLIVFVIYLFAALRSRLILIIFMFHILIIEGIRLVWFLFLSMTCYDIWSFTNILICIVYVLIFLLFTWITKLHDKIHLSTHWVFGYVYILTHFACFFFF